MRARGVWSRSGASLPPDVRPAADDTGATAVFPAPGDAAGAASVPVQERPVSEGMAMADQPPRREGERQKPAHKPPPGMSLDEQIKAKNYPPEVADALRKDVADKGTQERLERGELSLPSVSDAQSWYDTLPGD